jgi:hypothetical protein
MIQTHMLNATLRDELRGGTLHGVINFVDGLVAPSFIFGSGFVFAIALRRKLPDYLSFGPAFARQIGKLAFILALGYVLHIPVFSLRGLTAGVPPESWIAFWAVDVLQCIAVSLLLVLLVLLIVRNEQRLLAVIPWLAAGVALVTPLLWSINLPWLVPVPIAAYLNGGTGSQFPLFPWSVFLFAGVVAGGTFVRARDTAPVRAGDSTVRSGDTMAVRRLAVTGAGMVVASFLVEPLLASLYPPHDYWRTSPSFVLLRLGLVVLLLSLCYLYEVRMGVSRRSIVALIGRESLLVYTAHLMLMYGEVAGMSLVRSAGRSFGYLDVLVATVVLIGLMILLALWWDRIRQGGRTRLRLLQGIGLAIFVVAFIVSPG